ncbi:MAG: hypothetical protein KME54_28875 [Tolypothrix brevis GSE-NOS-MK-07-07A]|jgi:hypothetical protein|nr:hypothetical protein [Tolypothrix brevis GSE-NOS-MK-07-07A]
MVFRPPKCNCPDAINRVGAIPGASALSDQYASDWSSGFTGIKSVSGYCIHEMAVLRARKEIDLAFPDGLPTDLPVPPLINPAVDRVIAKLQNPSSLGDDFS